MKINTTGQRGKSPIKSVKIYKQKQELPKKKKDTKVVEIHIYIHQNYSTPIHPYQSPIVTYNPNYPQNPVVIC
jgi:hypothetical protein